MGASSQSEPEFGGAFDQQVETTRAAAMALRAALEQGRALSSSGSIFRPDEEYAAMDAHQKCVRVTQKSDRRPAVQAIDYACGLVGEAGEVMNQVKKAVFSGHPLNVLALQEELGDVLWYLTALADLLGLPLSAIARVNNAKLRLRYGWGAFDQALAALDAGDGTASAYSDSGSQQRPDVGAAGGVAGHATGGPDVAGEDGV